ncbi:MAG: hypothetical protein K2I63_00805, partial [Helicobacter sp.]|nr:hypothetical protein [Helicobacter sp.]
MMIRKFLNISIVFLGIFFLGCGYSPIAHQAKEVLGKSVFIEVNIALRDPKNSITLKDEVSKVVFEKLHTNLVNKEEADSF